jgi:hypothetical protein
MHAAQLFIEIYKSNKDENNIFLLKLMMAHDTRQSSMKSKFFLQISDHEQSVAPTPSRGLSHTPNSDGGR